MKHIQIGNLKVSRVGFGCASLSGYDYGPIDETKATVAINTAVDLGITLFDVADIYGFGSAEVMLSKALGPRRHDVVIATKFGVRWSNETNKSRRDNSRNYINIAVENSLKRLRIESIPIYQLHWPDNITPIEDVIDTLIVLKKEGKIQEFGICNSDLSPSMKNNQCPIPAFTQMPFSLIHTSNDDILKQARRSHNMSTIAYNVLGHGFLSGKYVPDSTFAPSDLRSRHQPLSGPQSESKWKMIEYLKTLASSIGKTPAQLSIAWALGHDFLDSALVGCKTPQHVIDACDAADITIPIGINSRLNFIRHTIATNHHTE